MKKMKKKSRIEIKKLGGMNTLVIKQEDNVLFRTTTDSLIISVSSLAFLIKALLDNGFVSEKVLVGILEEFNTDKGART